MKRGNITLMKHNKTLRIEIFENLNKPFRKTYSRLTDLLTALSSLFKGHIMGSLIKRKQQSENIVSEE